MSAKRSFAEVLKGKTLIIKDVKTDKHVQYRDAVIKEGIESMLVVPIKAKDEEVIGIMRLCCSHQRDFPEDMIMLVNALAQTGGLAIQNAAMYLQLKEDKESLEQDIWSHRSWF